LSLVTKVSRWWGAETSDDGYLCGFYHFMSPTQSKFSKGIKDFLWVQNLSRYKCPKTVLLRLGIWLLNTPNQLGYKSKVQDRIALDISEI
jgi:hypothetical protein